MRLLIGADPEVFVRTKIGPISGHVFECGTKEKPMAVNSGFVQVDGMALEFNVSPAATRNDFVKNTLSVAQDLERLVKAKMPEAWLDFSPVAEFGEKYISEVPPEVSALGCNPDYNAWTQGINPAPNSELPFRTASGHIHIGFTKDQDIESPQHLADCYALVKELDYMIGLPSLLWDPDNRRRALYGKAGAFRPKSYGLEYRVASNVWVKSTKTIEFVYDRTKTAVYRVFGAGKFGPCLHEKYGRLAQEIIDSDNDYTRLNWNKANPALAHMIMSDREMLGGKNASTQA